MAEEQAGFRAGRSTTEQTFNLRIQCEKYLQHQQNLYHVFIDFKNAFDRVWHAALWATMRKYNISANLVHTIEQLYDKATSAVQMSLIITLPKKGNWQLCKNYRAISLINHSSKVMLKVEIRLKNRLGSEPEEAPQNRSSTLESSVKSTSNISRICTMSSLISKKPLTEHGMQPYGPPCGSTISVQI